MNHITKPLVAALAGAGIAVARSGGALSQNPLNSESPQRRLLGDLRTPSREIASRTLRPVASVLFYTDHEDRGSKIRRISVL